MENKAQSEIITTILIILLVLSAVVIVWQVVSVTLSNTNPERICSSLTGISKQGEPQTFPIVERQLNKIKADTQGTYIYLTSGAPISIDTNKTVANCEIRFTLCGKVSNETEICNSGYATPVEIDIALWKAWKDNLKEVTKK